MLLLSHFSSCVFQIVVGGVADNPEDVRSYASCTLLAASMKEEHEDPQQADCGAIEACVEWLLRNEFIQTLEEERNGDKGMTSSLHHGALFMNAQ